MRLRAFAESLSAVALLVASLIAGHAALASAQTQFVPYFGKNNIHYDKFEWQIYTTDHFEIYYYPEIEQHLERVAGYAESAYQQISADLKHDLSFKVQLILFKTHSEFEQENIDPSAAQEGVGAFAEPGQKRIVAPIDDPPDRLYGLIVHELTHQFEFDIIPQGLIRRSVPLWVNEGLSDYERGQWEPLDLMAVRDAAIADIIPKMTELEGYGGGGGPSRLIYNLGHAVFEYIEAKFGKEGIRQFLFSLRKSVIGGGEDAYEEALRMKKDEFDQAFERYLKDRFKPFRDKERPADYGRDLSPNKEKTHYAEAFSIAPSPSGDLIAVVTINRKDRELDIILISAKDGSIVRNLTNGFDKDLGFDHIVQHGERFRDAVDRLVAQGRSARLLRPHRERAHADHPERADQAKIEERIPMKTVDEPESPNFSPDGKTIAFAALRGGIGDIYTVDLATRQLTNLTNDDFADYAPTYSPDGKFIIYNARVSGNQKLFRLDLDTKKKTQLTFGTVDETAAQFIDDHTLVFSSTATDPTVPLEPEVAKNGNIFNIWTLDLRNGELRQYTDALGGNWSAVVLNEGKTNRIAFVSYYKGEYRHPHARAQGAAAHGVDVGLRRAGADHRLPGAAPAHAGDRQRPQEGHLREDVPRGPAAGERRRHEQRRHLRRVAGHLRRRARRSAVQPVRRLDRAVPHAVALLRQPGAALPVRAAGLLADAVLLRPAGRPALRPGVRAAHQPRRRDRDAHGPRRQRVRHLPVQPLSPRRAVRRARPAQRVVQRPGPPAGCYQTGGPSRHAVRRSRSSATARWCRSAPRSSRRRRSSASSARWPAARCGWRTTSRRRSATRCRARRFDGDARHYLRIGTSGLLATRIRGFKSIGDFPDFIYFGGNSEMRGYDYLQFAGQNVVFANAELRFPLIEAALTPIGVIGGIRGVFFANIGGGWFNSQPSSAASACPVGHHVQVLQQRHRHLQAGHRLRHRRGRLSDPRLDQSKRIPARATVPRPPSPASACRTRGRPTASASRRSRSASRSTSTGRGARSSTSSGKTSCSPRTAAARRSASRGSRSGSATTSDRRSTRTGGRGQGRARRDGFLLASRCPLRPRP